ncbi:hypothetical protein RCF75_07045 [Staphylococcus equorum]|uniref:hypothetical protein n=1 Tax=Staphylococcus equorum TaxID=246432 RepID=UPI003AFFFE09
MELIVRLQIIRILVLSVPLGSLNNWTPTNERSECVEYIKVEALSMDEKESVSFSMGFILNDIYEICSLALANDNKLYTLEIYNNDELTSRREMNRNEYLEHTLELVMEKLSTEINMQG